MAVATPRLGRRPALDGLRGVAIALVFAFHLARPVAPGGFLGVDVFFVLSGFLITTLLLEEHARHGRIALADFYLRRALRLMPALFAMSVAVGAWELLALPGSGPRPLRDIASTLLYVANFAMARESLGMFRHTWSLAQEEQFYLVWPAALLALLAVGGRRLALGFCAVSVAGIAFARGLAWHPGTLIDRLYHLPQYRLDGMMIGCALGLARVEGLLPAPGALRKGVALAALPTFALLSLVAHMGDGWLYQGGFTVAAVVTGVLVVDLVERPSSALARALARPSVVRVGELSYALYLWHFPVLLALQALKLRWLAPTLHAHPSRALALAAHVVVPVATTLLSWAIAEASMRFIEAPARRIKARA